MVALPVSCSNANKAINELFSKSLDYLSVSFID
jgi:hypothetical protein